VLQWNNAERQKKILKEISRIVSEFAIIEHSGADSNEADAWRERQDDLFSGKEVAKLKRGEHFFTSRDEMERWMCEVGIKFERAKDFVIEDMAIVFAERFNLTPEELAKTYEILGDRNYLPITDWIIYPKD
jgi:hypothetical protein